MRRRARAGEEWGAQWAECGRIGAGTRRGSKPGEAGFPVGCDERTGRTGKQRVRQAGEAHRLGVGSVQGREARAESAGHAL